MRGGGLKTNETLTELNLGDNKLRVLGSGLVADLLKANATVTREIGLKSEGAAHIAESLACNRALRLIDLRDNGLNDHAHKRLEEAAAASPAKMKIVF